MITGNRHGPMQPRSARRSEAYAGRQGSIDHLAPAVLMFAAIKQTSDCGQ
jgi:hypothetical protein